MALLPHSYYSVPILTCSAHSFHPSSVGGQSLQFLVFFHVYLLYRLADTHVFSYILFFLRRVACYRYSFMPFFPPLRSQYILEITPNQFIEIIFTFQNTFIRAPLWSLCSLLNHSPMYGIQNFAVTYSAAMRNL